MISHMTGHMISMMIMQFSDKDVMRTDREVACFRDVNNHRYDDIITGHMTLT